MGLNPRDLVLTRTCSATELHHNSKGKIISDKSYKLMHCISLAMNILIFTAW